MRRFWLARRGVGFLGVAMVILSIGGAARAQVATVALVALDAASADDVVVSLPESQLQFAVGDSFFVELWAQTTDPKGLASVGIDLLFDASLVNAMAVQHTNLFSLFTNADIDNANGLVNDLSGAHLPAVPACSDEVGVAPNWARAAIVEMLAGGEGSLVLQAADTLDPIFVLAVCGSLEAPTVEYRSVEIEVCATTPCVSVVAPLAAAAPHDIPKNRFLSIDPGNAEVAVVMSVELLDQTCELTAAKCTTDADCKSCVGGANNGLVCQINSQCPGGGTCAVSGEACLEQNPPVMLGWISDPFEPDEALTGIPAGTLTSATVQKTMPAPRVWSESTVHLGDCEIAPVQSYAIRASQDGLTFSEPLLIATIGQPVGKFWADVVGSLVGGVWTKPNGLVNVNDVLAWIASKTVGRLAPHVTVVDLANEQPNFIINATDLVFILQGFGGKPYPPPPFPNQGGPENCP